MQAKSKNLLVLVLFLTAALISIARAAYYLDPMDTDQDDMSISHSLSNSVSMEEDDIPDQMNV